MNRYKQLTGIVELFRKVNYSAPSHGAATVMEKMSLEIRQVD